MPRKSRLLEGGENIFQKTKKETENAIKNGINLKKFTIGQPGGIALGSTIEGTIAALKRGGESMFEYQDNGSPGVPDFTRYFIQVHIISYLANRTDIDFLPTSGTKSMLGLIPISCGCFIEPIIVMSMSKPGYPIPGIWCEYLRTDHRFLPLSSENQFLFSIDDLQLPGGVNPDLVMINYPNNPSGQVAPKKWLEKLCEYCELNDIRLANDAAYTMLVHSDTKDSSTLTDVAINYPDLSWIELFSASKEVGNGTGLRIGGAVGSPDFIADLKTIKGNTDSGFVAPMAAGVLNSINTDMAGIFKCRDLYEMRMKILVQILLRSGMEMVVRPKAGFLGLCEIPNRAYRETIVGAEHFNKIMLDNTGVVGIPISNYIRYSVAGFPIEEKILDIAAAFGKANILY